MRLVGVRSSPELSGQECTVVGFDEVPEGSEDAGAGRFRVELADGRPASLPVRNCILPRGSRVWVIGLNSAAQWNDRWGRVESFDEAAERYVVAVEEGRAIKIKPENLRT